MIKVKNFFRYCCTTSWYKLYKNFVFFIKKFTRSHDKTYLYYSNKLKVDRLLHSPTHRWHLHIHVCEFKNIVPTVLACQRWLPQVYLATDKLTPRLKAATTFCCGVSTQKHIHFYIAQCMHAEKHTSILINCIMKTSRMHCKVNTLQMRTFRRWGLHNIFLWVYDSSLWFQLVTHLIFRVLLLLFLAYFHFNSKIQSVLWVLEILLREE